MTIRFCLSAAAIAALFACATAVQAEAIDGAGDPMAGLEHLPQASGQFPPTPLTTENEQRVLDAVFKRFPDADREAVLAFMQEQLPHETQTFTLLAMQDLPAAMEALIRLVRESLMLIETREQDPGRFAKLIRQRLLERRAVELARAGDGGDAAANAARRAEMEAVLREAFALKQDLMRQDIERMARQLDELKGLVGRREANRDAIIKQRVSQMAGDGAHLSW